jgi:hypothetical protein
MQNMCEHQVDVSSYPVRDLPEMMSWGGMLKTDDDML